jgi:pimeloyl-ACP methyl ester carboxylesterase
MLLAAREWGDSADPPALLVHGAVDSSSTWCDLGPWLADCGWHVIAVDLRGHGESQIGSHDSDYSVSTMAGDLVETIAMLRPDVQAVDLMVGHSLGTLVSLVCVAEYPFFVKRLVLEDPAGGGHRDYGVSANEMRTWIQAARRDENAFADEATRNGWDSLVKIGDPPLSFEEFTGKIRRKAAAIAVSDSVYVSRVVEGLASFAVAGIAERIDIIGLAERCEVPTLVLLALEAHSSIRGEERTRFCSSLPDATVIEMNANHDIHGLWHRDVLLHLATWLNLPN